MEIKFIKYQGAGNDFVMIDNRALTFPKNDVNLINQLCARRFGIGADGLILLENEENFDFRMVYYNADGNESSMCGNGGRCITAFAKELNVIQSKAKFMAIDGPHEAEVLADGRVSLGMIDVTSIEEIEANHYFLNTGSPHYVVVVDEMPEDIVAQARAIRYNERFKDAGVNVNFIKLENGDLSIRTYERGVEDETLACGTGSVAAGIVANRYTRENTCLIHTKGGILKVDFQGNYSHVKLTGEAVRVYQGIWA